MATVDKNYLYSIGRVKELEKSLLVETHLDRILESDDPLAVLRSIGFFKAAEDHERQESFHKVFWQERKYNRTQLHELVADSPLEDIFLLPYDLENIKLFLKGKLTANDAVKALSVEGGKFRKSDILEAVYDNLPTSIPAVIVDEIQSITEEFQAVRRFSLVDFRLDQTLRELQLNIAQQAKSSFMVEYLRRLSDIQNISTTLRRKLRRSGREALTETLFDTGTLSPMFFERVYDSGWESISSAFKPTEYDKVVAEAIIEVNQDSFLPTLDVLCTNYMIEFLQNAKRFCVGVEPILAFYLARDYELKAVRTILVGKKFGCSQEKLQLRMRKLYS